VKNLEQLAQPHRPNRRQHVERDASFGCGHIVEAASAKRLFKLGRCLPQAPLQLSAELYCN
jgi:hypothetical protein